MGGFVKDGKSVAGVAGAAGGNGQCGGTRSRGNAGRAETRGNAGRAETHSNAGVHGNARALELRSRQALADGLFQLMERDEYALLTVSQICQEARVSRQTFYHHYSSKDEIIEDWLDQQFAEEIRLHPDSGSARVNIQNLFHDFPISQERLALLKRQNLAPLVSGSMRRFLEEHLDQFDYSSDNRFPEYADYHHALIVSTLVTVLGCWISRDFRESRDELSEIVISVLGNL